MRPVRQPGPGSSGLLGGARAGTADLPLHKGAVPSWLRARMARLARVLAEAIILEYGRADLLRRLAHPFWFQSLGCLLGMDWHSSGITTSVVGALKRGLAPVERELGVHVCGGRGRHSRRTPGELAALADRVGIDGPGLTAASRLVAKVDTAAVQDGFDLYLHAFIVTDEGAWAVVQQGMNEETRRARRYHWLSEGLRSFVDEPHAAIDGMPGGAAVVNLTDRRADAARRAQVELVALGPDRAVAELGRLRDASALPHLQLPGRHDVWPSDVLLRRLHGTIAAAHARGPRDFQDLLLVPGVGARTVLALAMAAEIVHGAPCRFSDPARFSLAHGGKDGHPYPVPLEVYDRTLGVFRDAVDRARLGLDDRMAAIRRLELEARRTEAAAAHLPSFQRFVEHERRESWRYGGRTVTGSARPPPILLGPMGGLDAGGHQVSKGSPPEGPAAPSSQTTSVSTSSPAELRAAVPSLVASTSRAQLLGPAQLKLF